MRKSTIRELKPEDIKRIKCQRGRYGDPFCENQAEICETVPFNTGRDIVLLLLQRVLCKTGRGVERLTRCRFEVINHENKNKGRS